MTGITLSTEQIRTAPADVRQWIEQEISNSLGFRPRSPDPEPHRSGLTACSMEELSAILAGIQSMLPVVNVFFEFGREGMTLEGSKAFRLTDIVHNARLRSVAEAITCLNVINQALRQVRNDNDASFCGLDQDGYCFVPVPTQQNLLSLWREIVSSRQIEPSPRSARSQTPMPEPALDTQPTGRPIGNDRCSPQMGSQASAPPDQSYLLGNF